MVIGEPGCFFACNSDTVAQQSRNWQERFSGGPGCLPCAAAFVCARSQRKQLPSKTCN